jgi:hypothetical protein
MIGVVNQTIYMAILHGVAKKIIIMMNGIIIIIINGITIIINGIMKGIIIINGIITTIIN